MGTPALAAGAKLPGNAATAADVRTADPATLVHPAGSATAPPATWFRLHPGCGPAHAARDAVAREAESQASDRTGRRLPRSRIGKD